MYLRGLLDKGHFAFDAIMSENRFKFLLSHIRFDDYSDREKNWPTDCFAAMQPVWELFNKNLGKHIAPSEYLRIDETLYPMKHQIAFRQYNPNKPHKYEVLFKSLNETRFPYTFKSVPYVAKPISGDGPYCINSTIDYVKYLVSQTKNKSICVEETFLQIACIQALSVPIGFLIKILQLWVQFKK